MLYILYLLFYIFYMLLYMFYILYYICYILFYRFYYNLQILYYILYNQGPNLINISYVTVFSVCLYSRYTAPRPDIKLIESSRVPWHGGMPARIRLATFKASLGSSSPSSTGSRHSCTLLNCSLGLISPHPPIEGISC